MYCNCTRIRAQLKLHKRTQVLLKFEKA
uniref:Uncharacterized protein n=1 Tax=Anguilla anguilla TaxID=7936 RepID=A0A0E9UFD0_ANGAN